MRHQIIRLNSLIIYVKKDKTQSLLYPIPYILLSSLCFFIYMVRHIVTRHPCGVIKLLL